MQKGAISAHSSTGLFLENSLQGQRNLSAHWRTGPGALQLTDGTPTHSTDKQTLQRGLALSSGTRPRTGGLQRFPGGALSTSPTRVNRNDNPAVNLKGTRLGLSANSVPFRRNEASRLSNYSPSAAFWGPLEAAWRSCAHPGHTRGAGTGRYVGREGGSVTGRRQPSSHSGHPSRASTRTRRISNAG